VIFQDSKYLTIAEQEKQQWEKIPTLLRKTSELNKEVPDAQQTSIQSVVLQVKVWII
jgi:hypothetical protein